MSPETVGRLINLIIAVLVAIVLSALSYVVLVCVRGDFTAEDLSRPATVGEVVVVVLLLATLFSCNCGRRF